MVCDTLGNMNLDAAVKLPSLRECSLGSMTTASRHPSLVIYDSVHAIDCSPAVAGDILSLFCLHQPAIGLSLVIYFVIIKYH